MTRISRVHLFSLWFASACYSPNRPITLDTEGTDASTGNTTSASLTSAVESTSANDSGSSLAPETSGSSTADGTTQGVDATDTSGTTEPPGETGSSSSGSAGESTTAAAAVCGDGQVDDDEVCDDGINDGGYGGCAVGCSAVGPHCGDDVVQGAEACDDGGLVNGDGCNADCALSGQLVWTQTFEPSFAEDVAVGADDDIVVVSRDAVFRHYDVDGGLDWEETYLHADGGSRGVAVAYDPATGWLGAGYAVLTPWSGDSWWLRYNEAGQPGALTVIGESGYLDEICTAVAFGADGSYFVAGREGTGEGGGTDAGVWLRKYDSVGALQWLQTFDDEFDDVPTAVAVDGDGNVFLSVDDMVSNLDMNYLLRKYDADGTTVWTQVGAGLSHIGDLATDSDGTVVVTGFEGLAYEPMTRRYSAGGKLLWSQNVNGVTLALDSVGAVILAGYAAETYLRKLSPDGSLWWSTNVQLDAVGLVYLGGVATDSLDNIVVVGHGTSGGTHGWVEKYTP